MPWEPNTTKPPENIVAFKIQKGPVKEVGLNGCQVDTMIEAARMIIAILNENFPCKENEVAMYSLDCALRALSDRKAERESRGVEGRNMA